MSDDLPAMVRRTIRFDVMFRGDITIMSSHVGRVRISGSAPLRDAIIESDIVDLSNNGLGFITTVFIPKRTMVLIRAFSPDGGGDELFSISARVQRIVMTDRRPAYLVGVSFEDATPEAVTGLQAAIERLTNTGSA